MPQQENCNGALSNEGSSNLSADIDKEIHHAIHAIGCLTRHQKQFSSMLLKQYPQASVSQDLEILAQDPSGSVSITSYIELMISGRLEKVWHFDIFVSPDSWNIYAAIEDAEEHCRVVSDEYFASGADALKVMGSFLEILLETKHGEMIA